MLRSVTRKPAVGFIDLKDVLAYIRTANQIEKRCMAIAINSSNSLKEIKPGRIQKGIGSSRKTGRMFFFMENVASFFKSLQNRLFYVRSFRIVSFSFRNRVKAVDYCTKTNMNVMDVQFVRDSVNHFKMLHKGEDTYIGYFIDTKEID